MVENIKNIADIHILQQKSSLNDIYPVTYTSAVYDDVTGANLTTLLHQFNAIHLPYAGSSFDTRNQLLEEQRRKGIIISYVDLDGNTITEKCVIDKSTDDNYWGLDQNWQKIGDVVINGELTVGANGNWIVNGEDIGIKAVGPKGDNGITPIIKVIENKLYYSYDNFNWNQLSEDIATWFRVNNNLLEMSRDNGITWQQMSDPIAAWFRWQATEADSQANNIGRLQISRDNKTWSTLSGDIVNNIHINKYIGSDETLPTTGIAEGTIYAKGPTYAEDDMLNENPIYRLWVYAWKNDTLAWVDNGSFTSIAAGIVQETGDSENAVMSQKAVTNVCGNVNSLFYIKGKGAEFIEMFFNGLVSGKKYNIHLYNPNAELADTSGQNYRFTVSSWDGSQPVSTIITRATNQSLESDYYFTMPNDGTDKIKIGCRCAYGQSFPVLVKEDIDTTELEVKIEAIESEFSTANYIKDATLNPNGGTTSSNNSFVSNFLSVDKGTEVIWKFGDSTVSSPSDLIYLVEYNENKEMIDYWSSPVGSVERNIVLGNNTRYIRATFYNIGSENKYIKYKYNNSLLTWNPKEDGTIHKTISEIRSSVYPLMKISGNDTNLVWTMFHGMIAGKSYRLHLYNPNAELADTSGQNYRLYVCTWDGQKMGTKIFGYATNQSLESDYYFTMPNDGTDILRVEARCVKGTEFPVSVIELVGGGGLSYSSITELNPESEFLPKMLSAKKRLYKDGYTNEPSSIVIAHISDIHANWENVRRFLEFTNKYNSYIDLLVNTGDIMSGNFSDGVGGYNSIVGVNNIINVIGNHDTMGGSNWQQHNGLDVYNVLIKPWVSNWGVTQPEGASENGYCYFYKDYTLNKLRIVFVDIMAYDEIEDIWLANVLSEASLLGYHVLIAVHFAGSTDNDSKQPFEKIECNYSTMYDLSEVETGWNTNKYNAYAYHMMETVNTFIVNGGVFVGYMQGHYHLDAIAKVKEYPNQLIYAVGKAAAGESFDYVHKIGTRNQDEFQIVSVNTGLNIIKLFKVGANVDVYGRHKNSVTIDYMKGVIVAEGF